MNEVQKLLNQKIYVGGASVGSSLDRWFIFCFGIGTLLVIYKINPNLAMLILVLSLFILLTNRVKYISLYSK